MPNPASSATSASSTTQPRSTNYSSTLLHSPSSSTVSHSPGLHHGDAGAIAGAVIGAFVFLILLAVGVYLIVRRWRHSRLPPSAEFRHVVGTKSNLEPFPKYGKRALSNTYLVSLSRTSSLEENKLPPVFTPGSYGDPVFSEKVQALEDLSENSEETSEEGGYQ